MNDIDIIDSQFEGEESLSLASEIRAGFPSPAEDYLQDSLDFNRDMIRHPDATFYARVKGDSMIEAGICDGDIAVIDRSLEPFHNAIVVAFINNEFTIKYLDTSHQSEGYIELRPANPEFPVIRINELDHFSVWGVVVYTIKRWA